MKPLDKALRHYIIKRDSNICQHCYTSGEYARLHIHHLDSSGANKHSYSDHPHNLILLCSKCHGMQKRRHNSYKHKNKDDIFGMRKTLIYLAKRNTELYKEETCSK
jgi:5-methylcytosine-specific restriction endonuclease McrA